MRVVSTKGSPWAATDSEEGELPFKPPCRLGTSGEYQSKRDSGCRSLVVIDPVLHFEKKQRRGKPYPTGTLQSFGSKEKKLHR